MIGKCGCLLAYVKCGVLERLPPRTLPWLLICRCSSDVSLSWYCHCHRFIESFRPPLYYHQNLPPKYSLTPTPLALSEQMTWALLVITN